MKRRPLLLAAGLAAMPPARAATATGWVSDPIFRTPIFEPAHPEHRSVSKWSKPHCKPASWLVGLASAVLAHVGALAR
jgi:hypothetical protein